MLRAIDERIIYPQKPQTEAKKIDDGFSFLDLFSTSQTFSPKTTELSFDLCSPKCINNAPYFAYQKHEKTYGVLQGCCNSWNCPRCGQQRAKAEYGRIVNGCRELSQKHQLWFITITCRGKELSKNDAQLGYLKWTNTLITRWRTYATRKNQAWYYAAVTERQKRGHPHSHILTTWQPPNTYVGLRDKWITLPSGQIRNEPREALLSDYVWRSCVDVGLGSEYDISRVESVEGASRYVAKYLFKPTIFETVWPKGWKRVRYSQDFPKLPERNSTAFVLITDEDWRHLARVALIIKSDTNETKTLVYSHLKNADVIID